MRKVLAGLILLAATVLGADVSGTWNFTVETSAGSGTPTFVLKQEGDKLSGTYSGALGEAKVTGKVDGDAVTIEFQASDVGVLYTGKLASDGKTMKGKVDLGGQATGTFTGTRK